MNFSGYDVCVVSVYGRGHYLAAALKEKGMSVILVDVTPHMGRWAPEDWEGPFGFFQTDNLKPLWIERLSEQDDFDTVSEGFSIWLASGPIDFKGPLSSHVLENLGLKELCEKFLVEANRFKKAPTLEELVHYPFSKSWIVYLAHYLASNHYTIAELKIDADKKPLPFFSSWNLRRVSRKGHEKSLDWCETKGVVVKREANITDVSIEQKKCVGVEIESSSSGVISAQQYVWMLTGEETQRFPERVVHSLFPQGTLQPVWSWIRYRISFNDENTLKTLPIKFIILEDVFLPWTHENLLLLERCSNDKEFDVWLRIPSQHRFQKTYLSDMGEKIIKLLCKKIPQIAPTIVDMPQDFSYDSKELGPSPFSVFDSHQLEHYKLASFRNLFFQSPETWCPQDLSGQFYYQEKLIEQILLQQQKTQKAKSQYQEVQP